MSAALRRQSRRRRAERDNGKIFPTDKVNPGRARQIILDAKRRGLSYAEIGRLTGLNWENIERIAGIHKDRKAQTIYRSTELAVVKGLTDEYRRSILPQSLVSDKKSRQIIRSLGAQGWTSTHLDDILFNNTGYTGSICQHTIRNKRLSMRKENEDRILWLADTLKTAEGPSKTLRTRSRNLGYFPLKHYNIHGDLIEDSLSREQKAFLQNVRS